MAAVIALALTFVALVLCLLPLLGPERTVAPVDRVEQREAERERLLAAIRDVDLDFAMGKISAEDHAELRATLDNQAVGVLVALDAERAASPRPGAGA